MKEDLTISKGDKMRKNWIITEAEKADGSKDYAILENPSQKHFLDNILLELWAGFRKKLESCGYASLPARDMEIMTIESHIFTRYFEFMLFFDDSAFFRGTLSCSNESWMIQSKNLISLSIKNAPQVIFEILGNSRFIGNPPTLMIDKEHKSDYYQISFDHGYGTSWGMKNKKTPLQEVKKVIEVSIKMYEMTKDGIIVPEKLGDFISTAYDIYEAY